MIAQAASRPRTRTAPMLLALVLLALGTALGLWTSLHGTFASWPVDSDLADTVMLGTACARTGSASCAAGCGRRTTRCFLSFPGVVRCTRSPGRVRRWWWGTGWAVFVACASLAAWLGWRLARRPAIWALLPVLLLASRPGLGRIGWLAHPVTHTVTLLWGLLALHAAVSWMTARRPWALAAVGAALLIATLSDPWAWPALVLPAVWRRLCCANGGLRSRCWSRARSPRPAWAACSISCRRRTSRRRAGRRCRRISPCCRASLAPISRFCCLAPRRREWP